jgi:hypothetical protein
LRLEHALNDNTVSIIDCPVEYTEHMTRAEKLNQSISPFGDDKLEIS